jgi:hypothetical protein
MTIRGDVYVQGGGGSAAHGSAVAHAQHGNRHGRVGSGRGATATPIRASPLEVAWALWLIRTGATTTLKRAYDSAHRPERWHVRAARQRLGCSFVCYISCFPIALWPTPIGASPCTLPSGVMGGRAATQQLDCSYESAVAHAQQWRYDYAYKRSTSRKP